MTYKELQCELMFHKWMEEIWDNIDKNDAMGNKQVSFTLGENEILANKIYDVLSKNSNLEVKLEKSKFTPMWHMLVILK